MFVAVMEAGSFAAAAHRLGTSAGQASKLVARLEAELGTRLLHRTTRALHPTEAGQTYHARLRRLLDEYQAIDAEIRDGSAELRGTIRVGAPQDFGAVCIAPLVLDFARAHPGVSVELTLRERLPEIVSSGLDLVVQPGLPSDPALSIRRLTTIRQVVVASPSYLDDMGRPSQPEHLSNHTCILDPGHSDALQWTFRGGRRIAVSGRLRLSEPAACLLAAEKGLGLARVPDYLAAASIAAGRVETVLDDHAEDPVPVHALVPGLHPPVRVRRLIDALAGDLRTVCDLPRPVAERHDAERTFPAPPTSRAC
ncbi:LysR family transcriptional regulator [Rubellimicrobium sp. CFH 75288]|uniref:LysR family transcriptional regulator n=1 Tax=Rubellimicrobium sp. CFH 75288 TaxID=2697034 RepID=UPI00141256F3|nr:LysR family transcriptional regulator [Rubellimicrobium sp. CFH 75288]NAZ35316.1 LysR family transcriptional regulator [Rubellimicrobium sp. CFH 75288]